MTDVKQMARDLLAFYGGDATKWTQGDIARDVTGRGVIEVAPSAVCWCLMGALLKMNGADYRAHDRLAEALGVHQLPKFNDSAANFAEVESALKRIAEAP